MGPYIHTNIYITNISIYIYSKKNVTKDLKTLRDIKYVKEGRETRRKGLWWSPSLSSFLKSKNITK